MTNFGRFALTDKVAIVTGSGRGLGRAIALHMGEAGAKLVVCARSADETGETVEDLRERGCDAIAVAFDATRRADCERLIGETVKRYGKVDIMVVNHGISGAQAAELVDDETWDRIMAVNLRGVFVCAQLAARQMMKQETGGSIVAVSSTASLVGFPNLLAYGASKGGVDQMVRQMAVEWGDRRIRVNAVNPGYTTHNVRGTDSRHADPELNEEVRRMTPMRRRGTPEEIAAAVVFLASDAASFITGVVLPVDGGYCAM